MKKKGAIEIPTKVPSDSQLRVKIDKAVQQDDEYFGISTAKAEDRLALIRLAISDRISAGHKVTRVYRKGRAPSAVMAHHKGSLLGLKYAQGLITRKKRGGRRKGRSRIQ